MSVCVCMWFFESDPPTSGEEVGVQFSRPLVSRI